MSVDDRTLQLDRDDVLETASALITFLQQHGVSTANAFGGCALVAIWVFRGNRTEEEDMNLLEELGSWIAANSHGDTVH